MRSNVVCAAKMSDLGQRSEDSRVIQAREGDSSCSRSKEHGMLRPCFVMEYCHLPDTDDEWGCRVDGEGSGHSMRLEK